MQIAGPPVSKAGCPSRRAGCAPLMPVAHRANKWESSLLPSKGMELDGDVVVIGVPKFPVSGINTGVLDVAGVATAEVDDVPGFEGCLVRDVLTPAGFRLCSAMR